MVKNISYPISINNLNFKFQQKEILKNITFNVERSKFYGIIGPNGSGKTTLMRNICKNIEPKIGTVFIKGTEIMDIKLSSLAKELTHVPQNVTIPYDFTTHDIVLMGRTPYVKRFKIESEEDLEIVEQAMVSTDTWQLKDKKINEISGGEFQRVIIARALAQETDILLLDEPNSQLDLFHQMQLIKIINNLVNNKSVTVFAALHDLNIAVQYCDYLVLLNQGEIFSMGLPENVLTKEAIQEVYRIKVNIVNNPITSKPYIIPIE